MSKMPADRQVSADQPRAASLSRRPWGWRLALACVLVVVSGLAVATRLSLRDFPDDLRSLSGTAIKSQVLARDGTPLSYTLENAWNTTNAIPLAAVPTLLQNAFIVAEDQHFYEHHGVDWPARCAALWLDIRKGAAIRGA